MDESAYEWMFGAKGNEYLETLKEIRESIGALRETKTTFKLESIMDDDVPFPSAKTPEMARYVGAWKVPHRFPRGDQSSDRWVNPHAKWAPKYSDVAHVCECGATRFSPEFRADRESAYLDEKYTEPCEPWCPADDRMETKLQIWRNRRVILETGAKYVHTTEMMARRFDVGISNVSNIAENLGYDGWKEVQAIGYRKQRSTWKKLAEEYGVLHKEIGNAFGQHRQTVSDHIRGRPEYFPDEEIKA